MITLALRTTHLHRYKLLLIELNCDDVCSCGLLECPNLCYLYSLQTTSISYMMFQPYIRKYSLTLGKVVRMVTCSQAVLGKFPGHIYQDLGPGNFPKTAWGKATVSVPANYLTIFCQFFAELSCHIVF